MGFVQDKDEVPLHDPVAFQLLQCVTATVPPAVSPCHSLSWELQCCHQPPYADTSLKVVSQTSSMQMRQNCPRPLCMPALPKDWEGEFCLLPPHLVTHYLSLQFQPHISLWLCLLQVLNLCLVRAGASPA